MLPECPWVWAPSLQCFRWQEMLKMPFKPTSLGFCRTAIFVEPWRRVKSRCIDGSKWRVLLNQVSHGSFTEREEAITIRYGRLDDWFDELTKVRRESFDVDNDSAYCLHLQLCPHRDHVIQIPAWCGIQRGQNHCKCNDRSWDNLYIWPGSKSLCVCR